MKLRSIFDAFLRASRRSRNRAAAPRAPRGTASRNTTHTATRSRGQESGYAFLFVLGLMLVMIAASVTVLQMGATIRRRRIEQETIWRGNQYARAIRLYYHKTGHYPQTLDDLVKGMPDLHFLRQAYKNPTNGSDGSWRFIYVNAAGQIIGSTKYANLQQMALMDANGGQLPTLPGQPGSPGQPGVPVSTLASGNSGANSQQPQNNTPVLNDNSTGSTPAGYTPPDSTQNGSTDANGNPNQNPQSGQPSNGDNSQNSQPGSQNPQNPQSPGTNSSSLNSLGTGQNNLQGTQGLQALGQAGLTADPATLAAMALLKPTGPVDGPVLGGFLTGVGATQDSPSQRVYHGGKKYINWEFIWNPLEDAAAAMQQSGGGALGGGLPGNGLGQATTSPFGAQGGNNSTQPNPNPSPSPSNPFQQQPQQPPQSQQSQPQQ